MRRAEESDIAVAWYTVTDPETLDAETDAFIELMQNDGDKCNLSQTGDEGFFAAGRPFRV